MNCREASIQISLHVGDDLPIAEVSVLEEHLEHCSLCESEYESYASARDALFALKDETAGSVKLWDSIEANLDSAYGRFHGKGVRPWYRHPLFATSMAAALLFGISSFFWHARIDVPLGVGAYVEQASGAASLLPSHPLVVPETELVPDQEVLDFLDRSQSKGLLLQDRSLNESLIAVPVSNPNRGAY